MGPPQNIASHHNTLYFYIISQITYFIWFSQPTYEVIKEDDNSPAL